MNPRLRKTLLALLHAASGNFMRFGVIHVELADIWTATESAAELRRMEADGLLTSGRNPVGETTWRLTAAGQAAAAELGL